MEKNVLIRVVLGLLLESRSMDKQNLAAWINNDSNDYVF